MAGGSAQQQAAQRRATAERLVHEAIWLEALAADERSVAAQLLKLPPAYALLHDLRLPGSKGNVDHLVVGPGGAFVVVTRRCSEPVSFHEGTLWVGELSLGDVLAAAKVESQLLTQTLGTTVVPVVTLLGVQPPASLPQAIGGVLVCAADNVVRVITRASHTLLPPHKVGEATERALPLLNNPGSEVRTESALGVRADPPADSSFNPVVPASAPPSEESVERRRATTEAAKKRGVTISQSVPVVPAHVPLAIQEAPDDAPAKERSGRSRSFRFIVVTLVGLCAIALTLGLLARTLWSNDSDDSDGGADVTAVTTSVTTEPSTTAAEVTVPATAAHTGLAAGVAAPAVAFVPLCPAAGAGWQLQPTWPGDLDNLQQYDIELQNADGTWTALAPLATPQTPWGSLSGQPAGVSLTVRITAVMTDASRSISTPTVINAPAEAC